MSSNWINGLDMLADAGVIDYDAPAFVNGTKPRYHGSPDFSYQTPDGPKYQKALSKDEYEKIDNNSFVKNPGWKKTLFTMLAIAGIALGVYKYKSSLIPAVKNTFGNVKGGISKLFTSVKTLFQTK